MATDLNQELRASGRRLGDLAAHHVPDLADVTARAGRQQRRQRQRIAAGSVLAVSLLVISGVSLIGRSPDSTTDLETADRTTVTTGGAAVATTAEVAPGTEVVSADKREPVPAAGGSPSTLAGGQIPLDNSPSPGASPTTTAPAIVGGGPGAPLVKPDFSVQPIAGVRGSPVTIKGVGCKAGNDPVDVTVNVGTGDIPPIRQTANADGSWSVSFGVPGGAREGRHQVQVICQARGGDSISVGPHPFFVVVPGTTPQVAVTNPDPKPGDTLQVSGQGCLNNGVPGGLQIIDVFQGAGYLRKTNVTVRADGTWSGTVVVPLGTPESDYPLGANCFDPADPNTVTVFSIPVTIHVLLNPVPP